MELNTGEPRYLLTLYARHPELKLLAPDGTACKANTRGLLKRASITAGPLRYLGKEPGRREAEGDDIGLLTSKQIEYVPSGKIAADTTLKDEISKRGLREPIGATGLSQHTIKAKQSGRAVHRRTLKSKNYSEFVIDFF